ncbi:PREDICTED: probable sucrose-phosphate synthase 2 [Tarenaya hassleriana]|uniref:probable sucrose-phosphate synthase 2 n=1 Tax=Tarenaya hassleriana TaxID=28532 RepID=UPI00053C279E|nr:PREDICTED: probable sucrose-phosphate synthase 2 [Tarenaya hassleriana]
MVGNDWVNSYLEAILAAEPGIGDSKSSLLLRERGHFSPTRYFVEEVITGFDETDLHRSWIQAAATRSPQERNTRLENLCWRIWNLARQKKQIEGKYAKRAAKRHLERERARREATADMSEDLSDREKADVPGDIPIHGDNTKGRMPRISSVDVFENWVAQHKEKKLYIVLISLHGLIRGENMELGRDSDTGGQVKYVVELARALGSMPGVYRVDLLTRQVSAPDVDWSYAEPTEMLNPRNTDNAEHEHGESSGAYIIRIPFGPKDKYVPKELLWPHIPEFVDRALSHIMEMSKVLGEQNGGGQPLWPVAIHGHYADAGDSAALLSGALNVPMVFTGHSLGRDKLEQLLKQGRPKEEINTTYKIMRRIEAEELCLDASEIIITSTRQEIEEQWRLYDGFDLVLERKLRARMKRGVSCHGRFMPRMFAIPPGMEFHHIVPHDVDMDGEGARDEEEAQSPDPPIWSEIMRFFSNPRKPMILALARPDPKKNLVTLVKAFGECRPLRELANLTLIMGNRDDIDELSTTNSSVLLSILKLIDKYDLYGQVAIPKHHKQSDVPDIYRLAAKTKGVFINPAFIEPFGLTLIEAAAHGLPIVATKNGGPVDIHRVLDNGLLVDPHDQQATGDALLKLVSDKQLWARCRQNGLKNIHLFSWPEHCRMYLARIATCKQRQPQWQRIDFENSDTDSPGDSLRDIQDISLNLKLSLDGEKGGGIDGLDTNLDAEDSAAEQKVKLAKAVSTWAQKSVSTEKTNSRIPTLKRRKCIFVISVDCHKSSDLLAIIKTVIDLAGRGGGWSIGFILSTSMTISETHSVIISGGLKPQDFDAVICNSGSELYFTSSTSDDNSVLPYELDGDYHSHIEYRWGGQSLRKTLVRWAGSVNEKKPEQGGILSEDELASTNFCISFKVKDPSLVPPVKELKKLMRIQALRCNVVYCQSGARLNVIPVLASRSQALRYLLVRWGVDLSNVVVYVGESGDTDYEGLLGGVHKTVVLKGVAKDVGKLHGSRSYPLEDVTPLDSPNITEAADCGVDCIKTALDKLRITLLKS